MRIGFIVPVYELSPTARRRWSKISHMRTWHRFSFLTAAAAFGAVVVIQPGFAQQKAPTVMVFKTASCGCCSKWVDHMKAAGFQLKVQDVEDIAAVKSRLGVAADISSCHTSQVDGYVIEGHVPAADIKKFILKKSSALGLAVPGMPTNSPGMEAPHLANEPYTVWEFFKDGKRKAFAKHS